VVSYKAKFKALPPDINSELPPQYQDLVNVFTLPDISNLLEHSKYDLKIELKNPTNLPLALFIILPQPKKKFFGSNS
jgi:hypothetical protein